MWPAPITLSGEHATLEPLRPDHAGDLAEAVAEGDLHRLWGTTVPAPKEVPAQIERRLGLQAAGSMLAFAVLNPGGTAVGMTTYMNIDAANRRLEIGSTWCRESVQRTALNTECKLKLLPHAFEALHCIAVEFRTHVMNQASRRGIERLGAKLDGRLRSHMVMPNGTIRDTAVHSIVAGEWPAVWANLHYRMGM